MGDNSDYVAQGGQTNYGGGMTAYNPGSQWEQNQDTAGGGYNNGSPTYK